MKNVTAIRVKRVGESWQVDALHKMAKGRVVRDASSMVRSESVREGVSELLEKLKVKGVLG